MKFLIIFLLFIPTIIHCQDIKCEKTVVIEGYWLKFRNKKIAPKAFYNDTTYYYFIPVADGKGKSLKELLKIYATGENDTVKYLSYRPGRELSVSWERDCKDRFDNVIKTVQPFAKPHNLHRINKDYDVLISYSKMEWLHLTVRDKIACNNGFDRPATLACSSIKKRFFDIYLPLKILELNHKVKVVNKKLI